ncbi:MAG: hypothetical protein ACK56I_21645, partial [bacterium]
MTAVQQQSTESSLLTASIVRSIFIVVTFTLPCKTILTCALCNFTGDVVEVPAIAAASLRNAWDMDHHHKASVNTNNTNPTTHPHEIFHPQVAVTQFLA